jgi:subtilisin family serine protease
MNYTLRSNNRYKILTPSGYKNFGGVRKLSHSEHYIITLSNGKTIKSSINHPFMYNGSKLFANKLKIGSIIDSVNSEIITVTSVNKINSNIELFDIVGVDGESIFNVDGIISHNCDFVSSGDTVIDPQLLTFYKETFVQEPIEKTGFDGNLWKWEYPNYNQAYMVVADVARGDGADYSTAQVIDIANSTQVAEYKGKLDTKDFGNFLVSLATDYNEALLVIENANIGWAVIQQVIDRGYKNLFYMSKDLKYVDVAHQMSNKFRAEERGMVAGFSTTSKTRPLIISKLDDYLREKSFTVRSNRLIDELFTFIWNGNRAEAMRGYNDDLVMSLSIGLWVRDTALRLRQEGIDLTKQTLGGINQSVTDIGGFGGNSTFDTNPWQMQVGGESEDLTWLL